MGMTMVTDLRELLMSPPESCFSVDYNVASRNARRSPTRQPDGHEFESTCSELNEYVARCLREVFDGADSSGCEYSPSDQEARDSDAWVEVEYSATDEHDSVQEDVGVEKGKEDSPSIDDNHHLVVPGEYPNQFAALDSGDENEVASVFDEDEDDLGPRDPPAGDVGAAPDLHFEPTLLAAVGGVDEIERVNVRENVLQDSKYNGWTDPSTITPYPYMDEPYELTGSKKTTRVSMMKSMGQHRWRWKPLRRRRENLDAQVAVHHAKQEARKLKERVVKY
ncbi:hypothetical protein PR003_g5038 [Phytophthora rubi]|uniref:Uncharacterized protein n=1 Tax=Phytophthora rubi TaxID=129364 RepID=A0A6A4G0K0_9STRA|nr:hypothetical protein PR003_g5038 [Phytophthora rubi]